MKLQPEQPLVRAGIPPQCDALVAGFPAAPADGPVTQALLFVRTAAALQEAFEALVPRLAPDARVWIAHPKKSSGIATDLARDEGWEAVFAAGYHPVTQVAVDGDWAALRVRKRDAIKTFIRATPLEERVTEGVDYAARTVQLPADALAALGGLAEPFGRMSFTHQREWAEALAGAKKPETRARRIGKLVEAMAARAASSQRT